MRNRKIWNRNMKVLGTAMLLSLGVVGTAQAAVDGWSQENGGWVYYDHGSRVSDQWKKSANNFWFYLDSSGYMVRNSLIDGKYVNEDGAMVSNSWRKIYEDGEENWYYFTSSGRMAEDGWRTINNKKYHFDSDGTMDYGWFDDNKYYLGTEDDGAMKTGWVHAQGPEDSDIAEEEYDFFFGSNGVVTKDKVGKKINGYAYAFDKDGRMLSGWVDIVNKTTSDEDSSSGEVKDYQYYKTEQLKTGIDGSRITGWKQMDPPDGIYSTADDTPWYYFKDGAPYMAKDGLEYIIKTIGSKKYCFNQSGEMLTGFQYLATDGTSVGSSSNAATADGMDLYYFGEDGDGAMRTGTSTIYNEDDGEKHTYLFSTNGKGYTGMKNNSIYMKGKRLDAEKDLKYQVVTDGEHVRLVNTSGKIQKASSGTKEYEDGDGRIITINNAGEVVKLPEGYEIKNK